MPTAHNTIRGRSILLYGCALGALGLMVAGVAHAQPADPGKPAPPAASAASEPGGLDMDVNPTAPAAAAPKTQAGGLDMDVNPSASAPAPAPTPVAAGKSGVQAMSPDNVQDGARISTIDPAQLEAQPAQVEPGTQQVSTVATPPATTTSVATPAAPPATPVEPVNIDHPTVVDTADLKAGDTVIALYGIEGLPGDPAQGLQSFLASTSDQLTCQAQTGAGYVCLLPDGTDIAEVALVNGAARAKDDSPDAYRDQEAAAQAARRGIWANLPPPPATIKHPAVQDTATLVADGQTYALNGILGLGAPYAAQMQGYVAANGDAVTCQPQIEPGQYICMLGDGTDLAKVALVNGAARVGADAPDSYRLQQLDALNNHRGFWQNPPSDVLLAASSAQTVPVCCTLEAGDDGVDGITYVGGDPEAVIDGESVFLVYGGVLGWGYYDHWHHWRDAPDRYRRHLDRFHPGGRDLRGYGHDAEIRHDVAMHREEALRHDDGLRRDAALHPGAVVHAGVAEHPGMAGGVHPGVNGAMHPGAVGTVHPGAVGTVHPGAVGAVHSGAVGAVHSGAVGAVHPSFAGAGVHPATAGGFIHPGPSAGGFHPSAPAVHASAGGGSIKRK